jgi:hypothetical protein
MNKKGMRSCIPFLFQKLLYYYLLTVWFGTLPHNTLQVVVRAA